MQVACRVDWLDRCLILFDPFQIAGIDPSETDKGEEEPRPSVERRFKHIDDLVDIKAIADDGSVGTWVFAYD